MKGFILRYDNHAGHSDEDLKRFVLWCAMYEIEIKYKGRSKKGYRCHWLETEPVCGMMASIATMDGKVTIYKEVELKIK